jgi:hypothetical protein
MVNSVAMQQQSKCLLCGPIQGYITKTRIRSFSWSEVVMELIIGFSYWVNSGDLIIIGFSFGFGIRIEEQPVLGWRTKRKFNPSTQSRESQRRDSVVNSVLNWELKYFCCQINLLIIYVSELSVHWRFHLPVWKHPLTLEWRITSTAEKTSPVDNIIIEAAISTNRRILLIIIDEV